MTRERHVPFEAGFNFRDLGGYETADGRRVRWGAVFRSDALHRLTASDLDRIKALERENRELRQANEILRKASAYFAQAELDRPFKR